MFSGLNCINNLIFYLFQVKNSVICLRKYGHPVHSTLSTVQCNDRVHSRVHCGKNYCICTFGENICRYWAHRKKISCNRSQKFPRLPPPKKKSDKFSQSKSCVSLEMPAYSIAGAVERVQAPKLAISQLKCTVLKMCLESIFASPHLAAKISAKNIIFGTFSHLTILQLKCPPKILFLAHFRISPSCS